MYKLNFQNLYIVAISDTHGKHRELKIPSCDVLIHAGDVCDYGNLEQIKDFMQWFDNQAARHKIFVSGNHDTLFEQRCERLTALIPQEVIYLENSIVDIEGVSFASAPARGDLMAFVDIEDIDIFITHGAPAGILDNRRGCKNVAIQIQNSKPKYALFGHIHLSDPAEITIGETTYVNLTEFDN